MGTFARSWSLTKASWGVLREDKELVALPAISAVASLVFVTPFFAIAALTASTNQASTSASSSSSSGDIALGIPGYIALFMAYLVVAYITIFFQSALILAANERMTGGNPTLKSALRGAWSNAGHILPWAIISATVSIALQAMQERAGFIGKIVIGLVGVAWTLVTMLVLPILVIEHVGVKEALTRSGAAFKRTWGENVVGNGAIGLISMLAMFAGALVCMGLILIGVSTGVWPVGLLGAILMVVWIILVSVFSTALSGVFRTALYRYAMFGESSSGFSQDLIEHAFKPKKLGKGSIA
ncbi:unannotated protein [freshwater metagenome]|uniref:Unannotated protein n=1 Tax=freshwater metagenome TaxID=449393 RepID=A0A6J7HMZ7_9ZZZZ|nr:hypothetical protein [Actinomycetota bacterium]MSY78990.1 hypothetical protein [Actinomycetota bacterium]MTA63085.1 hypothetical protein [Actinomycetota bacterium]